MDALGDVLQESGSNLLIRWVLGKVNRDEELLSLRINIADINTTLVGEENPVALNSRWLAIVISFQSISAGSIRVCGPGVRSTS